MTTKKGAPLDIADLDTAAASDRGAEIELLHPINKKPLGIFINIIGKDSQVFRDHIKDQVNEQIRKEAMAKRRGKDIEPITAEEAEQRATELLVLCTKGWRSETRDEKGELISNEPVIIMAGEALSFNVQNAKNIYENHLWIRRQIDDAIGDLENFM